MSSYTAGSRESTVEPRDIPSPPDLRAQLLDLSKKRANRRGRVTRLLSRVKALDKQDLATVTLDQVLQLQKDLNTAIDGVEEIQETMDDLDDKFTSEEERVKQYEAQEDLKDKVSKILKQVQFYKTWSWMKATGETALAAKSITASDLEKFEDTQRELHMMATSCPDSLSIKDLNHRAAELKTSLRALNIKPTSTTKSSTTSSSSAPRSDHHSRITPLHVDVPKFHGDPLTWEAFELTLRSVLQHRAEGFSTADKFNIVRQAIIPPAGKSLVADKLRASATISELLSDLREMYGRPQLVVPPLVKLISNPPATDGSAASLTKFKEQVLDNWQALHNLCKGDMNRYIPHVLRGCLRGELSKDWERLLFEKYPEPTMDDFSTFIKQRLLWASSQYSNTTPPLSQQSVHTPSATQSVTPKAKPQQQSSKCATCRENHWLGRCSAFMAMSTDARNKLVREHKLCLNCFHPSHSVKQCSNKHSCRHCSQRHHTLLHREAVQSHPAPPTPVTAAPLTLAPVEPSPADNSTSTTDTSTATPYTAKDGHFTCTVKARLKNDGKFSVARVLIDHGSGGSFVSEELAATLGLKRHPQDRLFSGFGQGSVRSKFYVVTSLHSTVSSFATDPIQLSVMPKAFSTATPVATVDIHNRAAKLGLSLSDSTLGGKVDIILGGDLPWELCGDSLTDNPYRFISTKFGYGAVGPLAATTSVMTITEESTTLQDDLTRLWTLDKVPESSVLTTDEQQAVSNFEATTVLVDSRVQVTLPFKDDAPKLGNSKQQALRRFYSNELSLQKKGLLPQFNEELQQYITLGHAHYIPPLEIDIPDKDHYYMPVHGVFKSSSTTTKTRPVFDASAVTTSGHSLNQCLQIGPNLYPHLGDVLILFRRHAVGLSADISKMFREVLLAPEHRNFHRFLLRDSSGSIRDCRMERVTFGVASSPFLATQALRFLAKLTKPSSLEQHSSSGQFFTWTTLCPGQNQWRMPS